MTAQTSRAPLQASSPLLRENVGSIAVLTLDSPKTRNALSEAMIAALHEAIVSIREEKSVRAVVIAAQGPAYSSGHDLKELTARRSDAEFGQQPIDAHRSNIPTPIMTKMGPTEANPKSPKPSEIAERPARTELKPMAMEMMTGAVNTPVVTLPAS